MKIKSTLTVLTFTASLLMAGSLFAAGSPVKSDVPAGLAERAGIGGRGRHQSRLRRLKSR